MLDLTQRTLPNTITVDGRDFLIKTDFRTWIRFERDLKNLQPGNVFDCSYVFVNEHPAQLKISDLMPFARPKNELPRKVRHQNNDVISLDFDIDADYIFSAFMEQYGIDLIETDLHWWKFLAMLAGLNEKTTLSRIMMYRNYDKHGKSKDRDYYEEMRMAWEIIPPITDEEQAEIEEFESQFL